MSVYKVIKSARQNKTRNCTFGAYSVVAATHVEASPSLVLVFSPFLLSAVNFFFIFALLPTAFSVFFQSALMVHYYCKEKV